MREGLTGKTIDACDEARARAAERRALRRRLVAARRALAATEVERLSQAVCAQFEREFPELAKLAIGFYWPVQNEADLRPLIKRWLARGDPGFSALLPVVVARETPLVFRKWTPQAALALDACGILAPAEGSSVPPQALLIPVNGFDAAGYRLGYGGGYFDRTLAALATHAAKPLAIGVGFELARVASIHPEAHDIKLDAIVTEAGVFRCGRRPGESD
jgi:5,10-methenyltetrahydrofolate synthetase